MIPIDDGKRPNQRQDIGPVKPEAAPSKIEELGEEFALIKVIMGLKTTDEQRMTAIDQLGRIGGDAAAQTLKSIANGTSFERWHPLSQYSGNGRIKLQERCMDAHRCIRMRKAVEIARGGKTYREREQAVHELGSIGDRNVLPVLEDLSRELIKIKPDEAVEEVYRDSYRRFLEAISAAIDQINSRTQATG